MTQEGLGEEVMLEVYLQRRPTPKDAVGVGSRWQYWFDGAWRTFDEVEKVLQAHHVRVGDVFCDVPTSEISAKDQAELAGEIRKAFPGKEIIFGERAKPEKKEGSDG